MCLRNIRPRRGTPVSVARLQSSASAPCGQLLQMGDALPWRSSVTCAGQYFQRVDNDTVVGLDGARFRQSPQFEADQARRRRSSEDDDDQPRRADPRCGYQPCFIIRQR